MQIGGGVFFKIDVLVVGARGIPNVEGGAEKHAEMTFPKLQERGLSITLLGIRGFMQSGAYKGVRLRALPSFKLAQTDKIIYHFLCVFYATFARPRIVHLQGLNAALFLIFYKLTGLKVVLRYGSADHLHKKWGLLGRLAFKVCEAQVRFADHVIAVSQTYKQVLEDRYGLTNITVIPNGIDPVVVTKESEDFWTSLALGETPIVLSVGRLTVDKDFETLVRAAAQMEERPLQVVVAGGASEEKYAKRLFALNSERVHFLGRVERPLLASLYKYCAIYACTSHFEGQSNAVLEAVSFGCPVVASNISANRELELNEASYFPVGDAGALGAKLLAALENPSDFTPNRQNFPDWDMVAERTQDVYFDVRPTLRNDKRISQHSFDQAN
jgi:glycosyltransferase involved in cell wall biosynthesis